MEKAQKAHQDPKSRKAFIYWADCIDKAAVKKAVTKLIEGVESNNFACIKEFLDRYYGKPTQAIDVTTKGESVNQINYDQLTEEQKFHARELLRSTR